MLIKKKKPWNGHYGVAVPCKDFSVLFSGCKSTAFNEVVWLLSDKWLWSISDEMGGALTSLGPVVGLATDLKMQKQKGFPPLELSPSRVYLGFCFIFCQFFGWFAHLIWSAEFVFPLSRTMGIGYRSHKGNWNGIEVARGPAPCH